MILNNNQRTINLEEMSQNDVNLFFLSDLYVYLIYEVFVIEDVKNGEIKEQPDHVLACLGFIIF